MMKPTDNVLPEKFKNVIKDRWYILSGDVNPLDHGCVYFQHSNGWFEVSELTPLEDSDEYSYQVNSSSHCLADLNDKVKMMDCCKYAGLIDPDSPDQYMADDSLLDRLDAAHSYGHGASESPEKGNNAKTLLGFDPNTRKVYPD